MIVAAYALYEHERFYIGKNNEEFDLAKVRFKHAMRRLKVAYPHQHYGFWEQEAKEVVNWTIRVEAAGQSIKAAVAVARKTGLDLQEAASRHRVAMAA